MSEPNQITVQARGIEFGALQWGDPDGPLALLVHGYPDTAWTWRHLGPELADDGRHVVAPFTRGYAPTGLAPNDDYRVAEQAKDILGLHEALGAGDDAALVGHDWGAVATWAVTASEPERFSKYVAMSVPPPAAILAPLKSIGTLPVAARQLRMSWYFLFNQLPGSERALDWLIPKLWEDWSPGYDAHEDLARVFRALDGPGRRRAALRYYRNTLTTGLGELASILPDAPVLYLHGAADGCAQARIGAMHAGELPAGSRFEEVAGVGHFLQLEDPGTVNRLTRAWIGSDD